MNESQLKAVNALRAVSEIKAFEKTVLDTGELIFLSSEIFYISSIEPGELKSKKEFYQRNVNIFVKEEIPVSISNLIRHLVDETNESTKEKDVRRRYRSSKLVMLREYTGLLLRTPSKNVWVIYTNSVYDKIIDASCVTRTPSTGTDLDLKDWLE